VDTTKDRELSAAEYADKYSYNAGWDDARDMVWEAVTAQRGDPSVHNALMTLWDAMANDERDVRRAAYLRNIHGSTP
jgi:hypothetical protein